MTGLRNSVMGSIHFHDCRIPKERLISTSENGYDLMKLSLNQGRLQLSAVACGIAQRAMELALDYTCERSQYARSLYSYQSISFTISEMYAHIMPLRNMIYHTAELCQLQKPYSLEVSALKIFANEVCNTICMQAQDIHGAYGLSTNSDIERCMRDSRMLNAAEGTVQACKMTIASALPQEPIEHFL